MADLWLSVVLTSVLFGTAGAVFARQAGRNPIRWAILGAALNVGILVLMFIFGRRAQKAGGYTG